MAWIETVERRWINLDHAVEARPIKSKNLPNTMLVTMAGSHDQHQVHLIDFAEGRRRCIPNTTSLRAVVAWWDDEDEKISEDLSPREIICWEIGFGEPTPILSGPPSVSNERIFLIYPDGSCDLFGEEWVDKEKTLELALARWVGERNAYLRLASGQSATPEVKGDA